MVLKGPSDLVPTVDFIRNKIKASTKEGERNL